MKAIMRARRHGTRNSIQYITGDASSAASPILESGQVEHQHRDRRADHRGAQVRLLQDQSDKDQRRQRGPQDGSLPVVHLVDAGLQEVREEQHDHRLGQLRRLKGEEASQLEPAMRVVERVHAEDGHQQQRGQRHQRKNHARTVVLAIVHAHEHGQGKQAGQRIHSLLGHIFIRGARLRGRHDGGRREHHHQPKQRQQQDDSEQPLIDANPLRHA
jgi:hypothetical protein